jgi:hypothetical protein
LEEYIGDKWKGTHTQENVCAIDLEFLTTPTCKLGLWSCGRAEIVLKSHMGNKFPDHAPALQRTNGCTINAKTHSSYPARAKDQSEWSLRPRPGAVAPIDGSISPSAALRQDNSDGEIEVLCPAGSIDVSSCAEILLTHNCTRGCLLLRTSHQDSVQVATDTFMDSWCLDSVLEECCCCLRAADLAACCLARMASSCICSSRHSSLQKGVSPLYMKMSQSRPSGLAQSAQASSVGSRLGSQSGSASKKKAEAIARAYRPGCGCCSSWLTG